MTTIIAIAAVSFALGGVAIWAALHWLWRDDAPDDDDWFWGSR